MQRRMYTEGPIEQHLYYLTLPMLYSILANYSYILVEMYFLARLGKQTLTAISFVFPVVSAFQMVALGLGITVSSILSRLLGAKKQEQINAFVQSWLFFSLLLSLVLSTIGWCTITPLFRTLGAHEDTLPLIRQFMHIWYLGIFLVFLSFGSVTLLRVMGLPKLSGRIQILMAFMNMILSPLLIIKAHMGMQGAALAGVCTQIIGLSILASVIYRHHLFQWPRFLLRQVLSYWSGILAIACPTVLTNAIGPLSSIWMLHLLTRYSQDMVAGYGVASRVEQVFLIPLLALSGSIGPIIGQNFGATQYHRSYATLKKSYFYSCLFGILSALALVFAAKPIAHIFSNDTTVLQIATHYLWIVPFSYVGWGIVMMTNANFNAIGKPHVSTAITIFRLIVIFIPLSLVLNFWWGYTGLFISFALANLLSGLSGYMIATKAYQQKLKETDFSMRHDLTVIH